MEQGIPFSLHGSQPGAVNPGRHHVARLVQRAPAASVDRPEGGKGPLEEAPSQTTPVPFKFPPHRRENAPVVHNAHPLTRQRPRFLGGEPLQPLGATRLGRHCARGGARATAGNDDDQSTNRRKVPFNFLANK